MKTPPVSRVRWTRSNRLIPSRHPSAGILDRVAAPGDLDAVVELEAWTNDRISVELGILHTLPRDEWIVGSPMASVVMAAFCHPPVGGARFSSEARGAWYAARTLDTALRESVHRRTQQLQEIGVLDARMQMRLYHADFSGDFHDLRGRRRQFPDAYDTASYTRSQALGRHLLEQGSTGVLYDSVRDPGGECIACFRPRLVRNVKAVAHYEYVWEGRPEPRVRRLG